MLKQCSGLCEWIMRFAGEACLAVRELLSVLALLGACVLAQVYRPGAIGLSNLNMI